MTKKKIRVSFDFNPEAYEKLNELHKKSGSSTKADAVRNAIRLYLMLLDRTKEGYEIHYKRGDEDQRIEIIF
jgi:metal-responsive CopG/Arc/MetJ family transcriptional regulator